MEDLMIDLETYGVKAGCVILSIGAVAFDRSTGEAGAKFYKAINLNQSLLAGFHQEEKTVDWWKRQSVDAYLLSHSGKDSPALVLKSFSRWITDHFGNQSPYVWGNSARFDMGILSAAYEICKLDYPIDPFMERDYRTLTSLMPEVRWSIPFEGLKYDPINDCIHAIKVSSEILNRIRKVAA